MDSLSQDHDEHGGLTHVLLDGHHEVHAAAQTHRPLRLLSLLSLDASPATKEQVARVPGLRRQPRAARPRSHAPGGP